MARIRRANTQEWNSLIAAASAISNKADRAYSLGLLASAMPPDKELTKTVMKDAVTAVGTIPSKVEQIQRYEDLARLAISINLTLAKQCVETALQATFRVFHEDVPELQRNLIDTAYRLDPSFADSLISLFDNDPARMRAKQRIELLSLRRQMADGAQNVLAGRRHQGQQAQTLDYSRASWMALAQLNGHLVDPIRFESTRDFIEYASRMPLNKSYPILAWAIENGVRWSTRQEQPMGYLRPLFEATLSSAELTSRLATRVGEQSSSLLRSLANASDVRSMVVEAGSRETVLRFLQDWFESHVQDYLKICDPYFGPQDLEVLRLLKSSKPDCRVQILTSKTHNEQVGDETEWKRNYQEYWHLHVSEQSPPMTFIAIVGVPPGGNLPIHDRWWITKDAGLRIGTSFNSLGIKRDTEISSLTEEEAHRREFQVDQYLHGMGTGSRGERLYWYGFTLD